ncbi:DUF6881 domain-containing protein [Pseudoduganella sp. LjRoot289]|uniref:DUF6881 domain-containing protein n=1 Tax=Pseudoduganella sp. LjRoot289 TaxID=3342314 RepID=UPI003F4F9BE0
MRKVEIFADGRQSYASPVQSSGSSFLAECQFPSIDEIGKDPQFIPLVIAADEFQKWWEIALGRNDFG